MLRKPLVMFFLGLLSGAGTLALLRPTQSSGTGSAPGGKTLNRPAAPPAGAANRGRPAVKGDDAFLAEAASRDFGPGGPMKKDFQEILFRAPSLQRRMAFYNLLSQLTAQNAADLLAVVSGPESSAFDLHEEHGLVYERWGELDGPAACHSIFESDRRFEESGLSQKTIKAWAGRDPRAAYNWLMSQDDIPLRASMMGGLLDGYASADPRGAYAFIRDELKDDSLKDHGYWQVARSFLASDGLPGVQDFFSKFDKSDPHYATLSRTVADIFTDAKPAQALSWLPTLDKDTQQQLSGYVLNRLVRTQPDILLLTLAETGFPVLGAEAGAPAESDVIRRAVKGWVGNNPDIMGGWLKANPDLPGYDKFAAPFIEQVRNVDPQAAQAWAETIKDPVLREQLKDSLKN